MKHIDHLYEYNEIIKENDEIYRHLAKGFHMPECTFWILYTLRTAQAPMAQSELCRMLYEPKQTVNSALKKLEAEGFLSLAVGNDRRSKTITLTDKGETLSDQTVDLVISAEKHALLSLEETEQDIFLQLFHKYTDSLKQQIEELNKKT